MCARSTAVILAIFILNIETGYGGPSFTGKLLGYLEAHSEFRPHNVAYFLYTRSNTTEHGVRMMSKHPLRSGFNPDRKTVVLVHGTTGAAKSQPMIQIKDAILAKHNLNVISYDWSAYAQQSFKVIIEYYKSAGHALGDFLNELHNRTGLDYGKIHIIGHSVGVHVGAFAARTAHQKIHRLTGLDPSFLRHVMENRTDFIMPSDAHHVDCIRTSIYLGLRDPVCQCDFYANDGISQRGCASGICDHLAVTRYYANSVINPRKYPAHKCEKVRAKTIDGCETNYTAYAGYLGGTPCIPGIYQFDAVLTTEDAQLIYKDEKEAGLIVIDKSLSSVDSTSTSKNGIGSLAPSGNLLKDVLNTGKNFVLKILENIGLKSLNPNGNEAHSKDPLTLGADLANTSQVVVSDSFNSLQGDKDSTVSNVAATLGNSAVS